MADFFNKTNQFTQNESVNRKQGKFFSFLPFDFVVGILEYRCVFLLVIIFLMTTNSNVKELLFSIPLCKKDKVFCFCLWPF